jgi:aromatic-L-amino-acid/L-tryptophan decarboxylase
MDEDQLWIDREDMRRLGYLTVDLLTDLLADPGRGPVLRRASRGEMEARLEGTAPEEGRSLQEIVEVLRGDVLPYTSRCEHPGYLAFIPASGTWPGALGDFIASALNIYAGSWMDSSGPSQLELTVLDWFKGWIGYSRESAGILVSGGSAANMTALACARETLLGAMSETVVVYVSDQGHSSIARAARVLGFRPNQVRVLPVDHRYRMRPAALASAMEADERAELRPMFVCAAAGSTNTGAVDPLHELAAICRARGAWLHVDAAYGGFAALSERGRELLAGIEQADSVALDPHKWLYQPFECGCLLVRNGKLLEDAFRITPDYLRDAEIASREVNFSDLGLQLTRMSRALKVWVSLQFFGVGAFRRAIDRCLDLAEEAERRILASGELELMSPRALSMVCFRRRPPGVDDEAVLERINAELLRSLNDTGRALISSTRLRARYSLRMCIFNHTTTAKEVDFVLDWVERTPVSLEPEAWSVRPEQEYDRNPDLHEGWLGQRALDARSLRSIPLFRWLSDEELERVLTMSREVTTVGGEAIVEKWGAGNDFFVIVEGSVEIGRPDASVITAGPGEFFGELAALDWGAGFAYPRLASVTASGPTRLLVIPDGKLNELVRAIPSVADHIRRAIQERLPHL